MGSGGRYVRVRWIEAENIDTGLKIERIDFFEDLTLLVGLSGAGKSQILNAVEYSLNLAVRRDVILRPYCVSMGIDIDGDTYEWTYKIERNQVNEIFFENEDKYIISIV